VRKFDRILLHAFQVFVLKVKFFESYQNEEKLTPRIGVDSDAKSKDWF